MKRMAAFAVVVGLVVVPMSVGATLHGFIARIDGAQETPPCPGPGGSASTGLGRFTLDDTTGVLTFDIAFDEGALSSPETAAHVHSASPGVAGPIVFALPPGNPKQGSVTLTSAQQTALHGGLYYVNVHTQMCSDGEIRGQLDATPIAPGDHYQCFRSRVPGWDHSSNLTYFRDQFTDGYIDVVRVLSVCNPAQKNDEPGQPQHANVHQVGYYLRSVSGHAFFIPQPRDHVVTDQFGIHEIRLGKPYSLLTRSAKAIGNTPPPRTGINESGVDNFKCYKVGMKPGSPKFKPVPNVKIVDQFGSRMVDVKKFKKLCTPADVDDDDPDAPDHPGHLLCYAVKSSQGQPRFVPTQVAINDFIFGPSVVDVNSVKELCVPACKDEAAPCGSP